MISYNSYKNVYRPFKHPHNLFYLKWLYNLALERLPRLCLQTFWRANVTTTESIVVGEMSKITSCSAWNKDANGADCRNAKSTQLVCFLIITDELIIAAVLKHSNSVSNNISKDVIEEWNVTQSTVFREERCPSWKNIQTGALSPHIQRSQTSVHVLWVKYNMIISYSAATHFTKEISQQTSACQNPTALDISQLQHVGSSLHEHHPAWIKPQHWQFRSNCV